MKKTNPVIDAHHHWITEEHYRHPEPHLRPGDQVVRESDGFHVVRGNMKLFSASALVTQIDEHVKAKLAGAAHERCHVSFTLDKRHIVVEYPYGMSRREFEEALRRVADSAKRVEGAQSIGRLGIGIFSFQQIGRKCTFYSRKSAAAETIEVVLKAGRDDAQMQSALARDRLDGPGLRVVITELKFDPSRSRGPLAPDTLRRYLAATPERERKTLKAENS